MKDERFSYCFIENSKFGLIYFVCVISASVLGGIINFVYRGGGPDYIGVNALIMALTQGGLHELPASIFSRFKVNMVDRLIVIFGGYLVAWGIMNRFNVIQTKPGRRMFII